MYLGKERVELVRNLQRGAMLHLTMSLGQLRRQTRDTLWLFGAAVVALLAITVGQISVLQRTLVKPIAMLTQATELVRSRDEYGQRVSASGTDEVARLGRSFNAMMQAIEERENDLRRLLAEQRVLEQTLRESDSRKSEFLAVLSHELRNPLAAICTSIELLARSPPGSPIAARGREIMKRQTEHLTRLVDDLLDVTRISRGRIELQRARVDLRDVVRSTCDDFRPLFERGTLQLRLEPMPDPVWIDADATRLAQVIGNLLHNAAKFTPAGGFVTVRVEASGGRAEVSVRDTGVGMEPGEIKRLFEPFAQAPQGLARTRGGLGLGLALSKGLVELHGGSIQARSDGLGHGSEFLVRLPLAAPPVVSPEAPKPRAPGDRRLVLLIEDNVDTCESLSIALQLAGLQVRTAHDGKTGIATAHELKPEVVLCDIGLPDIDGYEVARRLREDHALRSTRIFALSGYARPEDKARAKEAGFDEHIAKPPDLEELSKLLG